MSTAVSAETKKRRIQPFWRKALFFALALSAALLIAYPFLEAQNRQTLNFQPISGPITNPLMGLAPWATIKESKQPHTLVYADLTWREFEPQRGVYDFDSFETKNQFARWRAENKRVVFRFVVDTPESREHMDIPDWLYDATGGSGDRYNNAYGKGFSPDYSNPVFLQYHREAIQALGKRYGSDGFIAYIELGSLGHWGEWHVEVSSGIRRLPEKGIRDQYVQHYLEAFPNTFLLMRRPFTIARARGLGLFNDMTGDPNATKEWLDWIDRGGAYNQTEEENALSAMPDAWRTAPIGGEQTSSMSSELLYGANLEQTLRLLEQSHTTFIGPHGPYTIAPGGPLQRGIDRVLETVGYRFSIQQVNMPSQVLLRRKIDLTVTFVNNGIAPMYQNWPVELYFFDETGEVRKTFSPEIDLRKILPGRPYRASFSLPFNNLDYGTYTVGFAIIDPLTQEPGVQLALENPRGDLVYPLGSFENISLREYLP